MSADPTEQHIRELEKENAELKHANEILQESLGFFAQHRKKWTMDGFINRIASLKDLRMLQQISKIRKA